MLACAGLWAAPASAHTTLTSSNPADGATLSAPPASVVLTFDEPLLADTETISINDMDGNVVASQQVIPDGSSVSVPWPDALTSGTFQVAYRVVSADGHPVTGAITFTITGAPASGSGTSSAGPPSSPPAPSSSPASARPTPSAPAMATASASAVADDTGSNGVPGLAIAAAAAALVVAAVAVVLVVVRRR